MKNRWYSFLFKTADTEVDAGLVKVKLKRYPVIFKMLIIVGVLVGGFILARIYITWLCQ
jgi:hypothetical protein